VKVRSPFRVLARHRNFRLFWGGQTVSLVGTWMQSVAQGWLALELTNDAFMVGLVSAAGALPVALLSLYGGVVADRHDRLRLVLIMQTLHFLQALAYWWLVWTGHVSIAWVASLALVGGAISAFEIPARQSLIVELVGRDDLLDAIALNSSGFNLARIIGPTIAGIVISQLGLAWCFGINALSFGAVFAGLFLIRLPPRAARPAVTSSPLAGLREGLAFMRRTPEVWALIRLVAVYAIFGAPYLVLMPVIARDTLGGDAGTYGRLLGAVGIGAILAALALAALSQRVRGGRLLMWGAAAFSLLLILFSLSRLAWLSMALLVAVGFAMIVTNALSNGMLQTRSPDALRGRVMAAYAWVFVGIGPVVGPYLAGALARWTGAPGAIGVFALITLAYGAWAFWSSPELRGM
jgi:MFS family permease